MSNKKEYSFEFSKYKYVVDYDTAEFKVFRFDEDITYKVMNNALFDLLMAYDLLYNDTNEK